MGLAPHCASASDTTSRASASSSTTRTLSPSSGALTRPAGTSASAGWRAPAVGPRTRSRGRARRCGLHLAAVQLDDVPDDREAEARARRADASTEASPCRNRSKMNGRRSGSMPSPVSATDDHARSRRRASSDTSTCPPRRRELDRVDEQVPHHLLQPIGIAEHVARNSDAARELHALRFRRRPHRVERRVDHRRRDRSAAARAAACR